MVTYHPLNGRSHGPHVSERLGTHHHHVVNKSDLWRDVNDLDVNAIFILQHSNHLLNIKHAMLASWKTENDNMFYHSDQTYQQNLVSVQIHLCATAVLEKSNAAIIYIPQLGLS